MQIMRALKMSNASREATLFHTWEVLIGFLFKAVLTAIVVPRKGIPYGFPKDSLFGYKVLLAK